MLWIKEGRGEEHKYIVRRKRERCDQQSEKVRWLKGGEWTEEEKEERKESKEEDLKEQLKIECRRNSKS